MDSLLNNLIVLFVFCVFQLLVVCLSFYLIRKRYDKIINKLQINQERHLDFLLKVKHDIPILTSRIIDLQEQITPPEKYKLN